jgi:hypothetical protein
MRAKLDQDLSWSFVACSVRYLVLVWYCTVLHVHTCSTYMYIHVHTSMYRYIHVCTVHSRTYLVLQLLHYELVHKYTQQVHCAQCSHDIGRSQWLQVLRRVFWAAGRTSSVRLFSLFMASFFVSFHSLFLGQQSLWLPEWQMRYSTSSRTSKECSGVDREAFPWTSKCFFFFLVSLHRSCCCSRMSLEHVQFLLWGYTTALYASITFSCIFTNFGWSSALACHLSMCVSFCEARPLSSMHPSHSLVFLPTSDRLSALVCHLSMCVSFCEDTTLRSMHPSHSLAF